MTTNTERESVSKFLSLVLRHQPGAIGLTLDEAGWTSIDNLLAKAAAAGRRISREVLQEVVDTNDKKRFAISPDGRKIRANQGHSITVEHGLAPVHPPDFLYHGTATRFIGSIMRNGLDKQQRHHVHMTVDQNVARSVGQRYGTVVLLEIAARRMVEDGYVFFRSDNGVWLTDHVPAVYIKAPS